MFTNDLSAFSQIIQRNLVGIGLQKDNITLLNLINKELANETNFNQRKRIWLGINYETKYIDKNLTGNNGIINVVAKLKEEPYAYKDKNGEPIGSDIDFIYVFAKKNGYKINLIEVNTYDEQIEFFKK